MKVLANDRTHFQAQTDGGEYYVVAEPKIGRGSGPAHASVYRADGSLVTSAVVQDMVAARSQLTEALHKLQTKIDNA